MDRHDRFLEIIEYLNDHNMQRTSHYYQTPDGVIQVWWSGRWECRWIDLEGWPPEEPREEGKWMGDTAFESYEDEPDRCCMTDHFGYRCEKRVGHRGKHNAGNPNDPFYEPDPSEEPKEGS